MAGIPHSAVRTHEAGDTGSAPGVAGVGVHPTSQFHSPAGGAHTPQGLERKSVAEAVGPEAVANATTVKLTPASDPSLPPHISTPGAPVPDRHGGGSGGVGQKLKEVWHDIKEITPGTKEHKNEFGTDMAMGGYRSQMGKR